MPCTRAGRLRVQIAPVRTAHGAPASTVRSSTPSTRTRSGVASTGRVRRYVRSCRRSPSHTAHHDVRAGPIRALAAHSIRSGPKPPIHVHALCVRMPGILAAQGID